MGASRQCQQHIPLNQKQPPYYSSYVKEGRAGCGTLTVRPVQIGMGAQDGKRGRVGSDDLTAGIAYVDRWPASSTQTVLRPSTILDLGRMGDRALGSPSAEQLGQVWPDRRAARQHPSHISFALMRGISRWQLLNQPDELMKHQIILRKPRNNSRWCFRISAMYTMIMSQCESIRVYLTNLSRYLCSVKHNTNDR